MKTQQHQRSLAFVNMEYVVLITIAAVLASLTLSVINKVSQRRREHESSVREKGAEMRH